MVVVRSTSPQAYEFACHSPACAPPPAGTGGSKSGGGKGRAASRGAAPKAAAAPKAKAAAGGDTPKGKIQSVESSKKVTGSGGKAALVMTDKYKDGSTEIHVERTNSKYYGESTTVTVKSKGKTIAKVFNDDDPPPTKKTVTRMLKEAKEWEKYGSKSGIEDIAGNLINEGGWQDYG